MRYVASCSFGKDSLATVILAKIHNEPLDAVVYFRLMFDSEISAEQPEHEDFIQNIAIPTLRTWGIKIYVIQAPKTFKDVFYHVRQKGGHVGKIVGFPMQGKCEVNSACKRPCIAASEKLFPGEKVIQYVGIAIDEPKRLSRLGPGKVSLLAKYGMTEADAFALCKAHGLLSPMYEYTHRGGVSFAQTPAKARCET